MIKAMIKKKKAGEMTKNLEYYSKLGHWRAETWVTREKLNNELREKYSKQKEQPG
jgi:hypothetical protein